MEDQRAIGITPRPTAHRPLIGRLVGVNRSFPGGEGARQRFTHVAAPFADTFLRGDVTVAYDRVQPRLARRPPARVYVVVRAPAGRLRLLRQIRPETRPIIDRFTGLTCRRWPSLFARAADSCGPGVLCRRAQPGQLHPAHATSCGPLGVGGRPPVLMPAPGAPGRPAPRLRVANRAVWRVPVCGRVGPPRRRVCHDRWPARHYGPGRDPPRTDGRCPAPAAPPGPRLRAGAGAPRKGAPPVETWKWQGEKGPCRRLSGC